MDGIQLAISSLLLTNLGIPKTKLLTVNVQQDLDHASEIPSASTINMTHIGPVEFTSDPDTSHVQNQGGLPMGMSNSGKSHKVVGQTICRSEVLLWNFIYCTQRTICTGTIRNFIGHLNRNLPEPHQPSAPEQSGNLSIFYHYAIESSTTLACYLHRNPPEPHQPCRIS